VLASRSLGLKYADRQHGRHVAMLNAKLFDALMEVRPGGRERLLLQVAALLRHRRVRQPARTPQARSTCAASQIPD
jgi:hypothetical protein